MCSETQLSDKKLFPTFARTEPIGRQLTPAIEELLNHFKWKKFAIMVEESTMYELVYKDIESKFKNRVLEVVKMPAPAKYTYEDHYHIVKRDLKIIKDKARSKGTSI